MVAGDYGRKQSVNSPSQEESKEIDRIMTEPFRISSRIPDAVCILIAERASSATDFVWQAQFAKRAIQHMEA